MIMRILYLIGIIVIIILLLLYLLLLLLFIINKVSLPVTTIQMRYTVTTQIVCIYKLNKRLER